MDGYDIKNYKIAGATSSIKASLFDITSELNLKILSLDEEINQDNDPDKIKIRDELKERLKNIISITDSFYDEIMLLDMNIDGCMVDDIELKHHDIVVENIVEEESEEQEEPQEEKVEVKEEPQVEEDEEDDNTVVISDKAIDDMMNVENEEDAVEIELGSSEEEKEETNEEKKSEDKEEKPESKEEVDSEEAIVVNLSAYQKLKDLETEKPEIEKEEQEEKTEETKEEDKSEDKLFDLENVKVEETEEKTESKEEEVSEEKKEEEPEDKGDAIVVNVAAYEKLKNRSLNDVEEKKKPEEEEETSTEEVKEETDEEPVKGLIDLDAPQEEETEEVTEEQQEESEEESEVEEEPVEEEITEEELNDDSEEEEVVKETSNDVELEEPPKAEPEEEEVEEEPVEEEPVELEEPPKEGKVQEETISDTPPALEAINDEEEEKPQLNETEQAIENQKQAVANKKISYIINKDNIDVAKAILVTSLQFDKLLLSRDNQKTLCKLRKYMVLPGDKKEETIDLEAMLQQAEDLYKQGKTEEAEALYNKISELNGN